VPDNVVLIGFSGTGKSTVGAKLAERLGRPFVDTDQLIVAQFGMSISDLFRDRGEATFRAAERAAVAAACARRGCVISVGGGAPVDDRNREVMTQGNRVVRLDAEPRVIYSRLRQSPGAEERPMLAGEDPLGLIRSLLASRHQAYAIAEHWVDTDERPVADVVDDIAAWLARPGRGEALANSTHSDGQI
jgi:shikimate kinase